jgi:hypothetical protein
MFECVSECVLCVVCCVVIMIMKMEIRKKVGFLPMVGFDPTTSLL